MVGVRGFEPLTLSPQTIHSTKLSYTPILKSIFVFYTEKIKLLLDFVLTGICLFNYAKCILYNLLLDSKTGYREVFLPSTNLVFTGLEISVSDSSTGTLSTSCSL